MQDALSSFPLRAQAMILAAGRGSRMRPLTDHTPKPLLRMRGQTMLCKHVLALARAGFSRQLINTGWLGAQIAAWAQSREWEQHEGSASAHSVELRLSVEPDGEGAALETLGGIVRALPQLDAVFWVLAGDVVAPDFCFNQEDYEAFARSEYLAQLWLVPNPAHKTRGDFCIDQDGLLRNLTAVSADSGAPPSYTFSTIALYKQSFFTQPAQTIAMGNPLGLAAPIAPLLRTAADAGRIAARLYTGAWTDVGTPERLAQLNEG